MGNTVCTLQNSYNRFLIAWTMTAQGLAGESSLYPAENFCTKYNYGYD